jgi:transposase-like protein
MSVLSKPYFHDEPAAFAFVEGILWPQGPHCYHCGAVDRITSVKANPEKRIRHGLYRCGHCKGQFTVRMGTLFEESKLPLHKWLQAIFLMCASKKGVSAHQLHRTLEVTYKTAWFLAHRIREAMRTPGGLPFMGGAGGAVEVDETFISHDVANPPKKGQQLSIHHMRKVLSLVDRTTGEARSFVVKDLRMATIAPILDANISREAWLISDEAPRFKELGWNFAAHGTVNHRKGEYVSTVDRRVHTNTVEGFYSIFKRGMKGVYQHCGQKHLHRYVAEFDFRYSNRIALGVDDQARAKRALVGVVGKRLTYRSANCRSETAEA